MSYRDMLRKEFEGRCARNGRYSLRAFARDLGISTASLSLILSAKQGVSRSSAEKIARKLSLSASERELFCDLAEAEHARTKVQREAARLRLRKHEFESSTLTLDAFLVMSDWYHFAILELTLVTGFQNSPKWIAQALGISLKATELAIERLKKLELLEEIDGTLRQTVGFLATPSGIPSDALKKFHQQVLQKAEAALFAQPVELRDFSAIMLPISKSDIPWAKEQLKGFRRGFMDRLEQAPVKDEVYCLAIQFFSLQEKSSQETQEGEIKS